MQTITLYEKIAEQIIYQIEQGILKPGERILSIRQASLKHKVSISTILHAYLLLENKGIIESRPQSGYYVRLQINALLAEPTLSSPRAISTEVDVSQLVFEVLNAIKRPGIIPLGSPFPGPELFPHQQLNKYIYSIGRHLAPWHAVGDLPPGNQELRRQIARRYLQKGYILSPADIVITAGATEALNLCLQAVTKPGDTIIIESPVFYAVLHAIERLGLKALEIPTHPRQGIDLSALANALKNQQIAACIIMPNFQNPLGSLMPEENKRALIKLLACHEVPLIEDDVYQELYFGDTAPVPAKIYDSKGLVLHCSSFSKTLAPGYRIGWAIPGRFQNRVEQLKLMHTLALPPLPQMAIAEYLAHGAYDRHLRKLRRLFALQMQQMLQTIAESFPLGTKLTRPEGGYVLWVELPAQVKALKLYQLALQHNISIAPGPIFSAQQNYQNFIRLNYGHTWTADYAQAIKTLGRLAARLI
jgi:DNA-binding transcriptional MocR family regulator